MTMDFESFRRERNYRRQQTREMERPGGQSDVWKQLEAQERTEMKDELLNAEVDDFFADATRLAATIVKRVASNHEDEISDQLRREMEEFLRDSIRHATNMVLNLDAERIKQGGESIVEPSLRNLLASELDEFRAEGTAQLADKHFGQDPFGTGLGAELRDPQDPTEPMAPVDQPAVSMGDAIGEGEITERRIRLSDAELSVDFSPNQTIPNFATDEFDARITDSSPLHRSVAPSLASENEDAMPLAASFDDEGTPTAEAPVATEIEADATDLEFGEGVIAQEFSTATTETELSGAGDTTPASSEVDAPLPEVSEEDIRRALLMLVDQGIMTPEQARAAYRKQTQ